MKKSKKSMKATSDNLNEAENNMSDNIADTEMENVPAVENAEVEADIKDTSENFESAERNEAESVTSDGLQGETIEIGESETISSVLTVENENAEVSVSGLENMEVSGDDSTGKKDDAEKAITKEKYSRRESKTGSIYPIYKVNKQKGVKEIYRWGLCLQLGDVAGAELRKRYGNKLRYLETYKSYYDCEAELDRCMRNKEKLLADKLIKLGYYTDRIDTSEENTEAVENG